jgi:pentapeptide MXKDX repeat protein
MPGIPASDARPIAPRQPRRGRHDANSAPKGNIGGLLRHRRMRGLYNHQEGFMQALRKLPLIIAVASLGFAVGMPAFAQTKTDAGIEKDKMRDSGIQKDKMRDSGIQKDKMRDSGIQKDKMKDTGIEKDKMKKQ